MVVKCCMIEKDRGPVELKDVLPAAKNLNGMAFKLYAYLANFPAGENFYERKIFMRKVGGTDKSVNVAFSELVEKNYLVPKNELAYFLNFQNDF